MGGLFLCASLAAAAAGWRYCNRLGRLEPIEARLSSWPRSTVVRDCKGTMLSVTMSEDGEFCLPVLLSEMGRWMPLVVVEVEDRRFWSHGGVDWLGVLRAAKDNLLAGKVRSGASTITSQVIRLCWPAERNLKN